MPSLAQSNRFMRLSILSPCATISLAAPTLANHLGITEPRAIALLSKAPSVLADKLETSRAKVLAHLLMSLGVAVQLDTPTARQSTETAHVQGFDLSIQPIETGNIAALTMAVAKVLPHTLLAQLNDGRSSLQDRFAGPGGLVFNNLSSEEINQTRRALRKISGLRIATSNVTTAIFDLLQDPRISEPLPVVLSAELRHLGLRPCGLTGAIAARVDLRMRDHILKRYAGLGLVALNRDFQRFDLFLTGVRNVSPRELADFLVVRSDLPRRQLERMQHPLKIETGLTRANALAFQSDYAALGLETCARLRVYHPIDQAMPGWAVP